MHPSGEKVEDLESIPMQHSLEKEVVLPDVTVQLATISWEGIGASPLHPTYSLFQRWSDGHSPVRIGNLSVPDVLPRVRSVGFLPAGNSIRVFPIEKPLRVLYCFYEAGFVESTTEIAREQWEMHINSLVAIRSRRLEVLMQEIYAEFDHPGFAHGLVIEAVTTLMLVELARHVRQLDRKGPTHRDGLALAPWQLRRIEERIEASLGLGYPLLSELADLCGISQGHLARSFKASTGWQIHKYIAEERIKAAKAMLAQGHLSCEEVSARLGFKSPAYFSTAFRRVTGKTPSELRRRALARGAGGLQ
jgi:AraC family transcriptional regulator